MASTRRCRCPKFFSLPLSPLSTVSDRPPLWTRPSPAARETRPRLGNCGPPPSLRPTCAQLAQSRGRHARRDPLFFDPTKLSLKWCTVTRVFPCPGIFATAPRMSLDTRCVRLPPFTAKRDSTRNVSGCGTRVLLAPQSKPRPVSSSTMPLCATSVRLFCSFLPFFYLCTFSATCDGTQNVSGHVCATSVCFFFFFSFLPLFRKTRQHYWDHSRDTEGHNDWVFT
ncbi:hypothetical protein F5148DRAFT_734100 [Russula earlei]|uniref:Uncharacterized protein n=1 Tax=Russula earlei TaxID=71964 RepID=A0ACC0UMG6_9AGAM|nr:hypothetical protein F5148DRAFT_734100 [Russula earlei]